MRSNIVINKENSTGYLINNNPIEILKNIFNIEGNFEIKKEDKDFLLYCNNELLCRFNVTYSELFDYIIDIYYKGKIYHYYCDDNMESLRLNMREYSFNKDNKNIKIVSSSYGVSAEITENNKGIAIDIEEKDINIKQFEIIVSSLKLDESLENIYNILKIVSSNNNVKIKKYTKLNTIDYRENITDLLIIRDGNLDEYLTSVKTSICDRNLEYVLKKDNSGYSVTFCDNSIDAFRSSYFVLDDQMKFVQKIEAKKRIRSKLKN